MKIRDLLVILFTAIVAVLVLARAALADRAFPTNGANSPGPVEVQASQGDVPPEGATPLAHVDGKCADACATICRVRCAAACVASKNPRCLQACYPVCRSDCYFDCEKPAPEPPDSIDPVIDPTHLLRDAGTP